MTYAVGFLLEQGLVLASDSRTNAGVDHVSVARKMKLFEKPGERFMGLLSSGNLAITQAVIRQLDENLETGEDKDLYAAPSMFAAARIVGSALREVYEVDAPHLEEQGLEFNAAFLFGGQVDGGETRLFMIYSAGNFIEASPETPFLQIGETKYGRPIIDRAITYSSSIDDAVKCALLSFDSTMRSNISVGPPIDIATYERGSLEAGLKVQLGEDDAYLAFIREYWGGALRQAFHDMPDPDWLKRT
ncbi:MAG: proteasome-type protease [Alphaproteobacteria bacterium]|nr:proteasome-type protease [Alphaproteobacteria bacterium]